LIIGKQVGPTKVLWIRNCSQNC